MSDNNKEQVMLLGAAAVGSFAFALAFVLPWTELGFVLLALAVFLLFSYAFTVEPTQLTRPKRRAVASGEIRTVVESYGLKVFVGSWNVGDAAPSDEDGSLSAWIPKEKYDIYAIGAQECAYKPRVGHASCEADWIALLHKHVGAQYKIVGSTSTREAIRLVVFIKPELDASVTNVMVASTITQLPFFWRKGANGIAFDLFDTSFCFVNAHLAAHQSQVRARENDVHNIIRSLFKSFFASSVSPATSSPSTVDLLTRFDNVIFFGDLNYRINSSKEITESLMKLEKWDELLTYDQLNKEHGAQRLFANLKLVNPEYGPTYKFLTSKKETSSGPKRTYATGRRPAWCDRILFSSGFKLSKSGCPDSIRSSDHSPVFSVFDATALEYKNDHDEVKLENLRLQFDRLEAVLAIPISPKTSTQLRMTSDLFGSDEIVTPICQGGAVWEQWDGINTVTNLSVDVFRKQRISVSVVDFSNVWSFEQGYGIILLEDISLSTPLSFKIPLFLNSKRVGELKGTASLHQN
eukprot:TRINITY_DN700_c0_g2_i2.p1 TRINITY_DN700_c0_g2~~TRINITY_DN700_c0_g2_i2.p1  ORF type:complete len:521 (+),score=125.94 TRINITY_DN700_c0_g2_i2:119-1681(+)